MTATPLRLLSNLEVRNHFSSLHLQIDSSHWGRSLVDLVNTLQELNALDVGFVSLWLWNVAETGQELQLAGSCARGQIQGVFACAGMKYITSPVRALPTRSPFFQPGL